MPGAHARVLAQFGANAGRYAGSAVHARGASLSRLTALLAPERTWQVLDVGAGAGHASFALAAHAGAVVAADVVPAMLAEAAAGARARGLRNVTCVRAAAERLPFARAAFDAAACRLAAHHFARPHAFAAEAARVLRTGARLALVDNVVGGEAAPFVNAWERRRDPSHVRMRSVGEWMRILDGAGLQVVRVETLAKRMVFARWADNMNVPEDTRAELLAELEDAPPPVRDYLRPELGERGDQDAAAFYLTEGILIAQRGADCADSRQSPD